MGVARSRVRHVPDFTTFTCRGIGLQSPPTRPFRGGTCGTPYGVQHRRSLAGYLTSGDALQLVSSQGDCPGVRSRPSVRILCATSESVRSDDGGKDERCTTQSTAPNIVQDEQEFARDLHPWPETLSCENGGLNVASAIKYITDWLATHNVVDPGPSAAELFAKAAGHRSPQEMYSHFKAVKGAGTLEWSGERWDHLRRLCALRAGRHVPIQYLVGEWDFYGVSLEMQPPTLIPRPETEELVDMILKWLRREVTTVDGVLRGGTSADHDGGNEEGGKVQFLDVGSGTGAIGLALLKELPRARCIAIDAQESAVVLSRRNSERLGVRDRYCCYLKTISDVPFRRTAALEPEHAAFNVEDDQEESVDESAEAIPSNFFDCVVSNPPYIPREDLKALPLDVAQHEDRVALDGGDDGLDVVRAIILKCPQLLRKGGPRQLWMEVDTSHPKALQKWLGLTVGGDRVQRCNAHGVTTFEWMNDLSGRPRFVRLTFAEERQ